MIIRGAEDLLRRLSGVRKKEMKKAIRKGSRAACKVIQREAKALVPKKSGVMRKSIKVRSLPRSRKWVGTQVTIRVMGEKPYYAGFVELGTKRQRAQHPIKRAAERQQAAASAAMVNAIRECLDNVPRL